MEDEPFDPLKVKVHPFIQVCIEVLGPLWDRKLQELHKKGQLLDKGIIYEHKPSEDNSQEKKE